MVIRLARLDRKKKGRKALFGKSHVVWIDPSFCHRKLLWLILPQREN